MMKRTVIIAFAILRIYACYAQINDQDKELIVLEAPDFTGMTLPSSCKEISLKQLSKVRNGITDTDIWLNKYLPEKIKTEYAFTPGGNKATEYFKSKVPLVFCGKYRRTIQLFDNYNIIYYGERAGANSDFGVNPTLVVITSPNLSDVLHVYDFSNFSVSQFANKSELDYTKISVSDVTIEDNILYAKVCHRTYSSSSSGYNAYLVAVDLMTQNIKWMTKPLTCNANYYIYEDVIFTGYGFTNEDDYIYIIDKASGSRLKTIKIEKGPDFFAVKDNKLYVRTYSLDYTFQIMK